MVFYVKIIIIISQQKNISLGELYRYADYVFHKRLVNMGIVW